MAIKYMDENEWIFTFGYGQLLAGYCVRIKGDYESARREMIHRFGTKWAFQYSAKEWDAMKASHPDRGWLMEKEIRLEDL